MSRHFAESRKNATTTPTITDIYHDYTQAELQAIWDAEGCRQRRVWLLVWAVVLLLFAGNAHAGMIDEYIGSMISLPNIIAGAVLAVLMIGVVNFILSSWLRALKYGLALVLLGLLLSMAGCTGEQEFSFAMGHKPRQNALRITGTGGKSYELIVNDGLDISDQIFLNTVLGNTLLLEAGVIEQQAAKARQQQTLSIFWAVIWAVIIVTVGVCGTTVYVVYAGRAAR